MPSAIALLVLFTATFSQAQEPRRNLKDCALRSASLRAALSRTIRDERAWSNAWGLRWGVLTTASLVASQVFPIEDRRKSYYVSAGGSAAALTLSWIIGPKALGYQELIEAKGNTCEDADALQVALERSANDERFMHSWYNHVGAKFVTLGLAAIQGFGFGHWVQAALTTGVGFVLGEWMIGARPKTAIEELESASGRQASAITREYGPTVSVGLSISPESSALSLRFTF